MNISQMILHRIKRFPRVKVMEESHAARRRLLRIEEGAPISASDIAWLLAGDTIIDREHHSEHSDFGTEKD